MTTPENPLPEGFTVHFIGDPVEKPENWRIEMIRRQETGHYYNTGGPCHPQEPALHAARRWAKSQLGTELDPQYKAGTFRLSRNNEEISVFWAVSDPKDYPKPTGNPQNVSSVEWVDLKRLWGHYQTDHLCPHGQVAMCIYALEAALQSRENLVIDRPLGDAIESTLGGYNWKDKPRALSPA